VVEKGAVRREVPCTSTPHFTGTVTLHRHFNTSQSLRNFTITVTHPWALHGELEWLSAGLPCSDGGEVQ